ncbi:phosphatidylinositol 4,5-bisphosphate 3-kinase catalytic subunit beta isoform-like [Ptychodera flava]|uniref:phosphatidylinositol 4,5-bisphosphate 3-kinase catalytic subunit beta isoform-like n=1 Tax=Ptychodera flava TaxID=63121 RepID=UPI00396A8217
MPPGSSFTFDIWSQEAIEGPVVVDCLLPTGVLVPVPCDRDATLDQVKKDLWSEAANYPLFSRLMDMKSYVFMCINQTAELEELIDEKRRICDVKPFRPVLKLVNKEGNRKEQILNSQISVLIGKGLHEFDAIKDPEVDDFRKNMRFLAEQIAIERSTQTWEERAMYLYPPEIEPSVELPEHIREAFRSNQHNVVNIKFDGMGARHSKFQVSETMFPSDLLKLALRKKSVMFNMDEDQEDYVLKVCGKAEYLLGNSPLSQYKYIRRTIGKKSHHPELLLVKRKSLGVEDYFQHGLKPSVQPEPPPVPPKKTKSLWNISEKLKIKIIKASNVASITENMKFCVRAGVYHGGESLCEIVNTKEKVGTDPIWNEELEFDINVCDIPRMARLCLVIYGLCDRKLIKGKKAKKTKEGREKEKVPLAWVNTNFFDYRNQLSQGHLQLSAWPVTEEPPPDMLNYIGTVSQNPNTEAATVIEIEFIKYSQSPVVYPPFEKVLERAAEVAAENDADDQEQTLLPGVYDRLRQIVDRDPLVPLDDQDVTLVWKYRVDCRNYLSHSLPKLLRCVDWKNSKDVAQMQALLQIWPKLEPEQALELLDYQYADKSVRSFAVECLKDFSDEQLAQYPLQLVQALKYESYLDCDLARFLLRKALENQTIGHYFFWHLRSEMHMAAVQLRFGLLLEAYCRGCVAHMKSLHKQVESLSKLKSVNEMVKSTSARGKEMLDKAKDKMLDSLNQNSYSDALSNLACPLTPVYRLRQLRVKKCKFMKSKMRPLWLVFENEDQIGDDIFVIFKHGDDLRQDMLTLQMFQIMDNLWQSEGLDLRMIPYRALSMGDKVGLIEVVTEAETISKIQKKGGGLAAAAAFKKDALFNWLKNHNSTAQSLDRAVEEFTLSCAGYCVATYVLGIGDRHNDNIMIRKTGQLFHIDFGHILGNFKSKFGIQRERVPFVLTHDFVHVITKGKNTGSSTEFDTFREVCEKAYVILRRKGVLFINLFAMMLSTGLPELSRLEDIDYLRETLQLNLSEEEAIKHFQGKFNEALKNSWKTHLNWAAHNIAHAKD